MTAHSLIRCYLDGTRIRPGNLVRCPVSSTSLVMFPSDIDADLCRNKQNFLARKFVHIVKMSYLCHRETWPRKWKKASCANVLHSGAVATLIPSLANWLCSLWSQRETSPFGQRFNNYLWQANHLNEPENRLRTKSAKRRLPFEWMTSKDASSRTEPGSAINPYRIICDRQFCQKLHAQPSQMRSGISWKHAYP